MDENIVRIKNLQREIAELRHLHQLDLAEIVRLRRMVEALVEK